MNFQQVLLFLISSAAAQRIQYQTVATGTVASNIASYQQGQIDNAQQRYQSASSYVAVNGLSARPTDVRNSIISSNLVSKSEAISQILASATGTVVNQVISYKQDRYINIQQRYGNVSAYIAVSGTDVPASSVVSSIVSSGSQDIDQFKQNISAFMATQTLNLSASVSQIVATVSNYYNNAPPVAPIADPAVTPAPVAVIATAPVAVVAPAPVADPVVAPAQVATDVSNTMAYYQQIYSDNAQQRQDTYSSYAAANNYTAPPCNCVVPTIISAQPPVINQISQNVADYVATQTQFIASTSVSQGASSIATTATAAPTPTTKLGFFQRLKMKKKQKKQKKAAALSSVAATATGSITASPTAIRAKNGFKNFFKKLQIKAQKSSSTAAPVVTSTAAPVATSTAAPQ